MTLEAYKRGDSVRFTGEALHVSSPEYYPVPGTVGVCRGGGWVQWPEGATSGDGRWHAPESSLEPAAAAKRRRVRHILCARRLRDTGEGAFRPHLEMHGENVGILGTPTPFRDVLGRPLAVGDIAELFNRSNVSYGDNAVCDDGTPFVMGIKASCDGATGTTGYWRLLRKRGFADVRHGERVDGVVYVKENGEAR